MSNILLSPHFTLKELTASPTAKEHGIVNVPSEQEKEDTPMGRFILAALAQKSMVTNKIFRSGSLLAGFSVDFSEKGLKGIKDYHELVEFARERFEK